MIRERVAEDVYVFTSQLYAQVNAGAIVGQDWSIFPTQQFSVTHAAALCWIQKVNRLWQQQSEAIGNSGI